MKIGILREESGAPLGSGVYSACAQLVQQLEARPDLTYSINDLGPDCDVIHAETTATEYLRVSLRHRDRLVVSAHEVPDTYLGSFVFDRALRRLARPWLRFVYNRASCVIAVSPYVKDELEKIGVRSEIRVICNSVDRSRFKPDAHARRELRRRHGLADDAFVALGVGQLIPRKNVEVFVRVAERMPDLSFVWLGGRPFGRLHAAYRETSRLVAGAPANCRFIAQVPYEEAPAWYAMADALFFPSVQECFSMVILEASATRLPLVLWSNPAYPAYLFDHYQHADTVDGFVGILARLAADPAERARWADAAGAMAQTYSIESFMDQLVGCYREVAARGRGRGET